MTARTIDVPVADGDLRVAIWGPEDPAAPTALLVHGITGSFVSWQAVARAVPEMRLIAPDLRGRGGSNALPPGDGMVGYATDLVAVLDHLGVEKTVAVGHSMGAFVSAVLAHRHPERVSRLVLVDGGLPLQVPEGLSTDEVISLILGPAAERLAMRFASPAAYLDFWRAHPALAECWGPDVEDYLHYDLEPAGEEF
ncbi:MAG: alpha/beta fold hydrolase, partial [Nocardioidaceae bacterium]|nr:alpha/beta fold hydrolase [Nocardioidaceae bacterium]